MKECRGYHRLRYGFGGGDRLVRGLITIISRGQGDNESGINRLCISRFAWDSNGLERT